jgi:predicted transcriptional regulator
MLYVSLDPELLREIDALAFAEDRSRTGQVRHLVRLGLAVAKAEAAERQRRLAAAGEGVRDDR